MHVPYFLLNFDHMGYSKQVTMGAIKMELRFCEGICSSRPAERSLQGYEAKCPLGVHNSIPWVQSPQTITVRMQKTSFDDRLIWLWCIQCRG